MHASDDFVENWKADIVRSALAAHGLEAPLRNYAKSSPRTRRRAVMSGTRTKSGAVVGFHGRASGQIVSVPECEVLVPEITALLPVLEALTRVGAPRRGEIKLAVTATGAGPDVAVTGGKAAEEVGWSNLAALAVEAGIARLSWDGETLAQNAAPEVRLGPARVVPPPGAFLQATEEGQNALTSAVLETLSGAGRVADLFAGAGTFALPLSREAEVHAVEGEADLLAALDAGWRGANGLKRITTEARDLFRRPLLADELAGFDGVVIDPPRAGAEAQMTELGRSGPPRIAAVSCNPVSFARDAAILVQGGYALYWIDVIDQFRWSPHIELAACFRRGKK
jgi:23S rRNA (uracil1939-C5)-methyltransferase